MIVKAVLLTGATDGLTKTPFHDIILTKYVLIKYVTRYYEIFFGVAKLAPLLRCRRYRFCVRLAQNKALVSPAEPFCSSADKPGAILVQ
jgi:hypothetical protein